MRKLLAGALLFAVACGLARAQAPVTVGVVMPQSGILADIAADLRKSLLLWQEDVNAGGGLLGRHVELRLLDDRSEASEVSKLYEGLILEHKADLLIGPLGSAASLGAAAVSSSTPPAPRVRCTGPACVMCSRPPRRSPPTASARSSSRAAPG